MMPFESKVIDGTLYYLLVDVGYGYFIVVAEGATATQVLFVG